MIAAALGWMMGAAHVPQCPPAPTSPTSPRHEHRYDMALFDPCGGSWTRDCRCGWRCPPQPTEHQADQLCTAHLAEQREAAA